MVKINKHREFLSILINGHRIIWIIRDIICIRLINSIQSSALSAGLGLDFDWLNRLCPSDEFVVSLKQLRFKGEMKLGWKDNVKRCCIIAKEVSFCFVLMYRARLISLKSLILLHVFLPHLIFRFHVKTFEIQWVKNALAFSIIMTTRKIDGFQ